jgi:hypothetical protein
MKTTYMIEDSSGNVLWYFKTLANAKWSLQDQWPQAEIVAMRGPHFGEGWHKYRMKLINGKFKKV